MKMLATERPCSGLHLIMGMVKVAMTIGFLLGSRAPANPQI